MFVAVNGIRLHCQDHGPHDGMPLLLIHGFPLSGEIWAQVVELLVRENRYRIIVPDLRGFGQSELIEHATAPPISIAQYADDLAVLLEIIGEPQSAIVVGLSMGGYAAMEFYRRFETFVRGLVL